MKETNQGDGITLDDVMSMLDRVKAQRVPKIVMSEFIVRGQAFRLTVDKMFRDGPLDSGERIIVNPLDVPEALRPFCHAVIKHWSHT